MREFKSLQMKSTIKDLLKKKKISYEDLASELNCSLPTIKRILGPEEISLTRLLEICDVLDVDLTELEYLSCNNVLDEERFSDSQEQFLAKNITYFSYMLKLFDGLTPLEIEEKYNLSKSSTQKYLIGLEKHGLIKVTGKFRVKPNFKRGPTLGRGQLARLFFKNLIGKVAIYFNEIIAEGLRTPQGVELKSKGSFGIQTFRISKASYDKWASDFDRMLIDLEKLGRLEEKSKKPEELLNALVVRAHSIIPTDHPAMKILDSTAGEITNI